MSRWDERIWTACGYLLCVIGPLVAVGLFVWAILATLGDA